MPLAADWNCNCANLWSVRLANHAGVAGDSGGAAPGFRAYVSSGNTRKQSADKMDNAEKGTARSSGSDHTQSLGDPNSSKVPPPPPFRIGPQRVSAGLLPKVDTISF